MTWRELLEELKRFPDEGLDSECAIGYTAHKQGFFNCLEAEWRGKYPNKPILWISFGYKEEDVKKR